MDQVEEVKNKTDIVELISEYQPLKKAGRNYKGLCPFHGEKTPSFMVNPELQIYKCFGCAEGGDAYAFIQKMEGVEFGEALRMLAKRAGVTLVSYRPTQGEETREKLVKMNELASEYYHYLLMQHNLGIAAKKYLENRGITEEAMNTFRLGFAPDGWDFLIKFLGDKKGYKSEDIEAAGLVIRSQNSNSGYYDRFRNRVMFPLANHRGSIVGFAGRVMPGADEKAGGKYVNTTETEVYRKGDLLYALNINKTEIKTAGFVVVVEGEIDSIASWLAGVRNVVAIKGSALTDRQVELLKRYTDTLVLGLDADLAGDAAARRGIEIAQKAGLIIKVIEAQSEKVNPKEFKDPGDWAIADPEGWRKAVELAVPIYDFYLESAVKRHGLDAIGKTKISRELLPIWVKIDDEILKAHYLKRLAETLGVGEEDVREQMKKQQVFSLGKGVFTSKAEVKPEQQKGRREVVEEYIVGLALRNNRMKELMTEPVRGWIKTAFWKRVTEELDRGEKKNMAEEVKKLPAELVVRVEELFLTEEGEKEWELGWGKALADLEKIEIRERMGEIKDKVEEEQYGAEWKKLTGRLTELTRGQ